VKRPEKPLVVLWSDGTHDLMDEVSQCFPIHLPLLLGRLIGRELVDDERRRSSSAAAASVPATPEKS
jgi:hypothetical protein